MHVNMEFGTVFVDEKVLPFLKDHSCSAGSSCCHRKNVLCEGWDIQRLLQHYIQVSSFAVHQTDFCIASALCHAHTLRAVRQLHAGCVLAWNLSSNLLNFARSVTMCSCPAIDHQASHVDSSCPLTHSEGILHVLVICHPGDLTCVVSIPVLFPSTGRVPVCGALAVTAP